MREGVRDSACFLLFMSAGVFTRPYVHFEVAEALAEGKPVILVHETDDRHGRFDFAEIGSAPVFLRSKVQSVAVGEDSDLLNSEDIQRLGASHESIGWERRDFKLKAVLDQIIKRFERSNDPRHLQMELVRTNSPNAQLSSRRGDTGQSLLQRTGSRTLNND